MATQKIPAWARFPRNRLTVSMVSNGFRNSKELLVSFPRLFSRLNRLMGVDTATVVGSNVNIAIDAKTDTLPLSEIGEFMLAPNDYIATRTSVSLTPATATVVHGNTQQLTFTVTYSDSSTAAITSGVSFSSSDTTLATVNATGLVTTIVAGSVTITASIAGLSDSTVITIT